jgi:hypothetical protein
MSANFAKTGSNLARSMAWPAGEELPMIRILLINLFSAQKLAVKSKKAILEKTSREGDQRKKREKLRLKGDISK